MKGKISIFVFLAFLLVVGGCATKTYPGPKLPREEVAVINEGGFLITWATITYVDDKKREWGASYIEVLPGEHTLYVKVTYAPLMQPSSVGIGVITFEAEAGHTYIVYGELDEKTGRADIWIIDEETEQIVAGHKPDKEKTKE